ncbi:prepilin-type N-terminal cleavage/methylation domain-containing protein [Candidatus Sumerlaeota bacterium]|nr:prepilin-type N-terminal cleavage/methylation domain-containing protein [Candidatus Sumerlaeota bacterium]
MTDSFKAPLRARPRRLSPSGAGFSLLELLVAMLVAVIILSAVVASFISILRTSQESQVLLNSAANARAALRTLSDELKQVTNDIGVAEFIGENGPLPDGDGLDNDGDGSVDEEWPNAFDDDGDWDPAAILHATAIARVERPDWVDRPDWGDSGVDEDNRFNRDRLSMRLVPLSETDYAYRDVLYEIAAFEDENRVFMRSETRYNAAGAAFETSHSPLAYQVLSFNALYWDPNAMPGTQYWVESWYSGSYKPLPGFFVPGSVLVELVVYADTKPIESYEDGDPVQTLRLPTIVDVEGVIQDAVFPRNP